MDVEITKSVIQAVGTVSAALIVGVAGAIVSRRYTRERDLQDKESQWRDHAIELTKLDLERKLKTRPASTTTPMRPSILDFLANYRDLKELGETNTPRELYNTIEARRIQASPNASVTPPSSSTFSPPTTPQGTPPS
jgi:hypothetical protein